MNTTDTYTLLDAIDDLTKPDIRREWQDVLDAAGKVARQKKVPVVLPPLLTQLDEAIRSSIGGSSSGATLASERDLLDADALYQFIKIATQIRDWCRARRIIPTRDPAKDLAAWYVKTLETPMEDSVEAYHVRTLGQWAKTIRAKMDPFREKDLPDACPECGATEWWRDGNRYYRPLVIRYKPVDAGWAERARGICRACEATWNVRELAYDIEQRDARTKDDEGTVEA